jgi:protease I
MATQSLAGLKVAVLATDGFEYSELTEPLKALKDAGAEADVVAPKSGDIQGETHGEKSGKVHVDKTLAQADAADYDALVLPGGVANPDRLRLKRDAVDFVHSFVEAEKPIAAICHGPWTLIEAGGVRGKRMTSWPSLKTDLANAGAEWVDEEVVEDGNLVTSRKPADLPAFCARMMDVFAQAAAPPQHI